MEDRDVRWAQNVVDRWAIRKAVAAPRVTTISTTEEITLSGYRDSAIILNEKAWDRQNLAGKILLLADPFSHHAQCASGAEPDDEKAETWPANLLSTRLTCGRMPQVSR